MTLSSERLISNLPRSLYLYEFVVELYLVQTTKKMSALRNEILTLYKSLLKEGKKFSNYNFRMYALRRVRDNFKENISETNPQKIETFITFGKQNLEILKRQVIVGNLYKTEDLVIEKKTI